MMSHLLWLLGQVESGMQPRLSRVIGLCACSRCEHDPLHSLYLLAMLSTEHMFGVPATTSLYACSRRQFQPKTTLESCKKVLKSTSYLHSTRCDAVCCDAVCCDENVCFNTQDSDVYQYYFVKEISAYSHRHSAASGLFVMEGIVCD